MATPKLELSLRLKAAYSTGSGEEWDCAVLEVGLKIPGQDNRYDELHLYKGGDLVFSWPIDLSKVPAEEAEDEEK